MQEVRDSQGGTGSSLNPLLLHKVSFGPRYVYLTEISTFVAFQSLELR